MKKVCRVLVGIMFALILTAFLVPAGEVRAAEGGTVTYFIYDCWREPSYPTPGQNFTITLSGLPKDQDWGNLPSNEGWELIPVSYENAPSATKNTVKDLVWDYSSYGDEKTTSDFPIFNLRNGDTDGGYVVVVWTWNDGKDYFAVSGALYGHYGYYMTRTAPTDDSIPLSIPKVPLSSVAITGIDVPVVDVSLDTSAICETAGIVTRNLTVTYEPNDAAANANVSYQASVTLQKAETCEFEATVTATVDGNPASSVVKNEDGTLTVSYILPEPHVHDAAEGWSYNRTYHWHECEAVNCPVTRNSAKPGYAAHVFGEWSMTQDPTGADIKVRSCECGCEQTASADAPNPPTIVIPDEEESQGEAQNEEPQEPTPAKTFEQELEELILAAKAEKLRTGNPQTIKVISYYKDGITLTNKIMKLLIGSDITLDLEYRYDGKQYRSIIAAGMAQNNEIPFYGPLYLYRDYGVYCGEIIW